ncbi:MAG: Stp1/IreP family PP2C-type Ser/Thr phosphatase [Candidatus Sumerlaeia bacterium]|nr:Stp1/IreP family PP2C-type Ser/Thr phosphatase [Candidatus Sumerlaeia bacterium]
MPQTSLKIQAAGLSDRGLKRAHNEDSLSVVPDLGLFIVADGMGGHNAGEVASRQAIESIVEFLRDTASNGDEWPIPKDPNLSLAENRIVCAIKMANRDVCRLSMEHPEYHGMGTTLVGALLSEEGSNISVAHVGDSRCYRLRNSQLEKITLDHSWVEEQLQRGIITLEEAKNHRWKNVITRALGNKLEVDVEVQTFDTQPGDLFLLCSDGLSGMVDDQKMEDAVLAEPDLEVLAQELIRQANEAGGHDNISLILIRMLHGND